MYLNVFDIRRRYRSTIYPIMFRWMQSLSSNQAVHELQVQARHKLKHR